MSESQQAVSGKTIPRHAAGALDADDKAVVWITAPAGSGKTVLAKQLCRESGEAFVWLRAEPRMADMGVFLTSLEAAFRKSFPKSALPALASQDIALPVEYLRRLISLGCNGARITLVLDDLHVFPADAPMHQALADAVGGDAAGIKLILVSREAQHPAWLRLNAIGLTTVIDFDMLKLNEIEANQLIRGLKDDCNSWTAAELLKASGGWMLGACLLLQSPKLLKAEGAADQLSHNSARLLDLIAHELIDPLSEPDRMILCRAARLPNLPVKIIARALEMPNAERRLVELADKLLFAERDGQYRLQIHDLFKAALLHRYPDAVSDTEASRLSSRAGQEVVENGGVGEGLLLLSASGAWSALSDAVIIHAPAMSEKGELGVVLTALEPMPEAERAKSRAVLYWYGESLLSVNPPKAREVLSAALEAVQQTGPQDLLIPTWTALIDAIWFKWTDFDLLDPLIAMLPELSKLASSLGPHYESTLSRGAFVAMLIRCPDHRDFPYWEQRNLDFYSQPMPRHETIRRGIQLLFRYCYGQGHRWKASQVRTRLNQVFEEETAPVADICNRYFVTAEFLSIFDATGDETFRAVEQGLEANARFQQKFLDGALINAALYKALTLEDRVRARRYLTLFSASLGPTAHPHYVAFHQHFSAWDHWLGGEHDAALALILLAYRASEGSGMAMFPVHYGNAVAAVLQSLGRRREALAWARRSRRAAFRQNSSLLVFLSGLRCASLAIASSRPERAEPYLRAALAAGSTMRFYLHAWISRSEMALLMRFAVEHSIETDYANELIRVLGLAGEIGSETGTASVHIVSLERFDVLEGAASRLTSGKLARSPIALAVHLIAAGPAGESSEILADRLWPEIGESDARKRMKSTVYRLRQLIGLPEAVVTQGGRIALDPEHVSIDAWELMALATAPGWTAQARYAEAARIYRGPFVYHYADDIGLVAYQQKLEAAALDTCVAFARSLSLAADWPRVSRVAREGLDRIGFSEALHELAAEAAGHLGIEFDSEAL
ncbi:hypothetical protein WNZ14_21295 [Hoeflea sp. AS60]|uniref:AfsR/SARP family transcriptional regulator n=1 Tax=Hoeflea sp. AS60 TaxID=3135780 RepID=UPI0031755A21